MAAISVLGRVKKSDIVTEPFPYVILANALPDDYYKTLASEYPSFSVIAGSGPHPNNHAYRKSAAQISSIPNLSGTWSEFFAHHQSKAFFDEVVYLFGDHIRTAYPDLESCIGRRLSDFTVGQRSLQRVSAPDAKAHDIKLDVQFGVNSPVTKVTSVRTAHLDSRFKLFASLLYFKDERDNPSGGELEILRYDPAQAQFNPRTFQLELGAFEVVSTVAYKPNNLVFWVNTIKSLHGVSPRGLNQVPRRYINFLGETYRYSNQGLYSPPGSDADAFIAARL